MPATRAPLSFSQESLWLTEEIVPGLTQYQMVAVFEIGGPLDRTLLERSIATTVRRHELLRSRFTREPGGPWLTLGEISGDVLGFVDLSSVPAGPAADGAVDAVVNRWFQQPLDLGAPPLLRGEVVKLGADRHLLVLTTHHIVSDELSFAILQRELFTCYEAYAAGAEPDLPKLTVQYADYTTWQRDQTAGLNEGLSYWAARLADLPAMRLPADLPRPGVRRFTCAWTEADLPADAVEALGELARNRGTSMFTVLLATFELLLAHWTGSPEVVVGTPVAGRPEPELEHLVGFFVNSVVLRGRCEPGEAFADLLTRVQADLTEDLAYEHVPFHLVVERVNPGRDRGVHPLFHTAFHMVALDGGDSGVLADLTIRDRSTEFLRSAGATTEFDVVAQVILGGQRPRIQIQYAAELFRAGTIEELAEQYGRLIAAVAVDSATAPEPPTFTRRRQPPAAPVAEAVPVAVVMPAGRHATEALEIFRSELDVPEAAFGDDFFAIGGSSLIGVRVVQRLRDELALNLSIIDLFDAKTIGELLTRCGVEPDPAVRPSYANTRLAELNRLAGRSAGVYNCPVALRLTGEVDVAALRAALRDLAERHEPLRTVHLERDGGTVAAVLDIDRAEPDFLIVPVAAGQASEVVTREAATPFDLGGRPPWRARLFDSEAGRTLLIVIHRVAADAWSTRPLLADLAVAYTARTGGRRPGWEPLPMRYSEYLAGWSDRPPRAQLDFWRAALAGRPEVAGLPARRAGEAPVAYRGDWLAFDIPPEVHYGLRNLAARHRANLFMVLQAGVAATLTELGAGTDILIGCAVAGRPDRRLDDLVGAFANRLVLRVDTGGDPSVDELVRRVRRTSLAAFANGEVPLARLTDRDPGSPGREQSLFPVAMTICTAPVLAADLRMPGLTVEPAEASTGLIGEELAFEFTELDADQDRLLWGVVQYATELFDRATAQELIDRVRARLVVFAAHATRTSPSGQKGVISGVESVR
ncbi:condensation domain-containing protein [Actinoplanes sp. NPDC049265]|uniref:condensation domain-containing protein n=1 Tax=Actinoplanes sp. NPDC049265 TaxID=3363902 RepID=UPI0037168CB7